jgi:hypothetical protein
MTKFEHYILTIFNVQIGWRILGLKKIPSKKPDDNWMWHRINLFEKYCFPSILKQTNQNFRWIVLFDKDTKPCFKEKIEGYKEKMPNFCPYFIEGKFKHGYKFNKFVDAIEEFSRKPEFLITTRLDCDDACHRDFIEIIQNNFQEKNEVLAPTDGHLFLEDGDNYKSYISKRWRYPRTVFITVIDKVGVNMQQVRNCYTCHHSFFKENTDRLIHPEEPIYLMVVHDKNLSNREILFKCFLKRKHLNDHQLASLIDNFNIRIKPHTMLL